MVEVNAMKRATRKRVRRTSGLEMNIAQHFWNLLAVAVIGSIVVAFVLVQQHEVKVAHPFQNPKAAFRLLQQDKPFLLYGTAWKEDKTAYYVQEAIRAGFRYIDTAAQPKHYREAGVGEGWTTAAAELKLDRAELFLQTKFSPHQKPDDSNQNGATLPYDPNAELREQVQQSVESSLKNLKTDYIDSLVLHSPLRTMAETLTVWKAMEELVDDGTVKMLGVSNCYNLEKFETIFRQAKHKPWALQNRFYADSNFDTDLRQFCAKNGIKYQSFWTLTANGKALQSPEIKDMAQKRDLTPQTLLYAFLMSLGYGTPLSGTKSAKHMKEDVLVMKRLQDGEVIFQNEDQLRKMAQLLGMPAL
ncbi:Aldose reductase-related protein 1 [Seminavis robusta]|uniref:Aldose reductase-related protein 1 n=1 Tax=Seminavis robusta TaxID=568900 RepID=A0A9N8DBK7_9STRA|nr:Aldose reductase-related protein 1 [Seminavis robusta]|eukprot:Sro25_g016750.1 Aldose reductase-related protein 1 (359) ;mRNA; f:26123-27199